MGNFRIVVEHYTDGFVAYPLGVKGVIVGQGDVYESAVADLQSALQFHADTFGPESREMIS